MTGRLTKAQDDFTVRICPMRDGPCPHGMDCPFKGDGPFGYSCKEGWRAPAGRRALAREQGE